MMEWYVRQLFEELAEPFYFASMEPSPAVKYIPPVKSPLEQKIERYAEQIGKEWNSDPSLYRT